MRQLTGLDKYAEADLSLGGIKGLGFGRGLGWLGGGPGGLGVGLQDLGRVLHPVVDLLSKLLVVGEELGERHLTDNQDLGLRGLSRLCIDEIMELVIRGGTRLTRTGSACSGS